MSRGRSLLPTRIMGHRSLAEMYAKDVLSDVDDGAADVSTAPLGGIKTYVSLRRTPS